MKKTDDTRFIGFLQEMMLSVCPPAYKKDGIISLPDSMDKELFYETICNHACLMPSGKLVKQAFEQLLKKQVLNILIDTDADGHSVYKALNSITVKSGEAFVLNIQLGRSLDKLEITNKPLERTIKERAMELFNQNKLSMSQVERVEAYTYLIIPLIEGKHTIENIDKAILYYIDIPNQPITNYD